MNLPEGKNWMEIVPPLPPEEADRRLEEWKRGRELRAADLRRDQVRTEQGCLIRYLVRSSS